MLLEPLPTQFFPARGTGTKTTDCCRTAGVASTSDAEIVVFACYVSCGE